MKNKLLVDIETVRRPLPCLPAAGFEVDRALPPTDSQWPPTPRAKYHRRRWSITRLRGGNRPASKPGRGDEAAGATRRPDGPRNGGNGQARVPKPSTSRHHKSR